MIFLKTRPNPELLKKIEEDLSMERDSKMKIKLLCLKAYAQGMPHKTISTTFNIPSRTLNTWKKKYREGGSIALVPVKQSGRPPKLSKEQLEEVSKFIDLKGLVTSRDVKIFIYEKYKVTYESSALYKVLSKKLNCTFKRPYTLFSKRPENAEEILIERLEKALQNVATELKTTDLKKISIGFMDESSPQNKDNKVKFWSNSRNPKISVNPVKLRANTAGYYAIRGNSVAVSLKDSKADSLSNFLKEIHEKNLDSEYTILILDNCRVHHSKKFVETAKNHNIELVFLPPYSPDLNPIEFIWKCIKRVTSEKNFDIGEITANGC